MDKFIQKAEELKATWQELSGKGGAYSLFAFHREEYDEAKLNTSILFHEFQCQPLIDKLEEQSRAFSEPADMITLLEKLIETARFRNKSDD